MSTSVTDARGERSAQSPVHPALPSAAAFALTTAAAVGAAAVLAIAWAFHVTKGVSYKVLAQDVTVAAEVPIHVGMLSQFGLMVWAGAAATALTGGAAAYAAVRAAGRPASDAAGCLLAAGVGSLILGVDDAFLMHEAGWKIPGVDESHVLPVYALAAAAWAIRYRRVLWQADRVPLALAGAFFAASVLTDKFVGGDRGLPIFLEDGAKLFGVAFWLAALFLLAIRTLAAAAGGTPAQNPGGAP